MIVGALVAVAGHAWATSCAGGEARPLEPSLVSVDPEDAVWVEEATLVAPYPDGSRVHLDGPWNYLPELRLRFDREAPP